MRLCLISAPTATDFLDEALLERAAIKAISEHPPLGILKSRRGDGAEWCHARHHRSQQILL